jgi:hypothetical protein
MGDYIMSTIKANDIQNASGGIPTVKGQRLIPTAWVNFNGTGTVAINDDENVSSVTDLGGLGQYQINFTTAMANANYCPLLSIDYDLDNSPFISHITTTSYRVLMYTGSAYRDVSGVYTDVLGGQA